MAKLVDVYVLEENTLLKRRQLPLDVDDNLTVSADFVIMLHYVELLL